MTCVLIATPFNNVCILVLSVYCYVFSGKGKVDVFKKAGNEIGRQLATKSGGLFSAEDWQCPM